MAEEINEFNIFFNIEDENGKLVNVILLAAMVEWDIVSPTLMNKVSMWQSTLLLMHAFT